VRVPHFETLRIEKRKDRLKTRPQSSLAALGRAETLSQTNQSPVMDHAKYVMMMKAKKLKAAKSQPVPEEELQRRKIQSANDRKSLGKKPISEEEFQRRLNQSAQSKLKSNAERLHVASPKEGLRPPIKRGAAETRRKTRAEMKTGATPLELLRRQIQGAASRALTLRQEGQRINPAVLQALEAMSELEILTSTDPIPGADRLSSTSNAYRHGKAGEVVETLLTHPFPNLPRLRHLMRINSDRVGTRRKAWLGLEFPAQRHPARHRSSTTCRICVAFTRNSNVYRWMRTLFVNVGRTSFSR